MKSRKRVYRSTLRQAQAAATRERIVEAAQACFEELGYTATTMRNIASRADVSVEAVHLSGSKRELMLAAFVRAFAGQLTDKPLLDQDIPKTLLAHADPYQGLADLVAWVADRNRYISDIWHAFDQAADLDADIRVDYLEHVGKMRAECNRLMKILAARKVLRTDSTRQQLADQLWIAVLPDQCRRLCSHAGWSHGDYRCWVVNSVISAILIPRKQRAAKSSS